MIHNQNTFRAAQAYGPDIADRVRRFMPVVRKYAWYLGGSTAGMVEVEDLMQTGLIALTEAAQRHEGPCEDGFAAYAKLRVRGAMVDLVRSASPDRRGNANRRKRLDTVTQSLSASLGRQPWHHEIAAELGISVDEYHRQRAELEHVKFESLQDCYADTSGHFRSAEPDPEAALLHSKTGRN
ncbi:MAG: sigma-70 family RNA polymerase sigma factor [Sphingomonadaceae bacterium]